MGKLTGLGNDSCLGSDIEGVQPTPSNIYRVLDETIAMLKGGLQEVLPRIQTSQSDGVPTLDEIMLELKKMLEEGENGKS